MNRQDQIAVIACAATCDARWVVFADHRAATRGPTMAADAAYWAKQARKYRQAIVKAAKRIEVLLRAAEVA